MKKTVSLIPLVKIALPAAAVAGMVMTVGSSNSRTASRSSRRQQPVPAAATVQAISPVHDPLFAFSIPPQPVVSRSGQSVPRNKAFPAAHSWQRHVPSRSSGALLDRLSGEKGLLGMPGLAGSCVGIIPNKHCTSNNASCSSDNECTAGGAAVNGVCGTSNGSTFTSAPGSNLCTTGTATGVTTTNTAYTWGCAGSGGGTSVAAPGCSATRNYAITTSVIGSNGTISNSQNVAYHAIPIITASPSGGYAATFGGTCGGTPSGNSYTVNSVTASCTVTASFSASITAPAAPSITGITPSSGQLSVAFTAGSSNGSAITNYKYSTDGGSTFTAVSPAQTTSPIVITGLTNGTSYNVQIRAVNAAGDGTATANSSGTPATIPSAPSITGITGGNGQLSVAFTAGATGGSAITNYKYSTDGGTTFTAVSPTQTTSPITITGLTNGTSYNVQIRAVNAAGDGTATANGSGTPMTTPAAPSISGITPSSGQLSVAFTAGSSNGSAITNYKYSTDGGTTFTAVSPAQTTSPIVITGLTNGSAYFVQLKAVNIVGDGTATGSTYAMPATIPSAPSITGVTAGNGQLTVAFTAGASNGSSISNYKYSTDGGTTFTALSPAQTTSPITITGLTNGTSYNVQIRAVNGAGDGAATGSSSGTPMTIPAAPSITGITGGNGQLSVAFTAGATGGSAITNYKYSTDGGTTFTAVSPAQTTGPIVITGLTNGTSYNVQIKAVNAAGDGSATSSTSGTPVANAAPVASNVTVSLPGGVAAVAAGVRLTGSYTYSDTESDTESGSTFQWYTATNASCTTGKTPIGGATASTYTVLASQEGKYLCFGVTPKAASGTVIGSEVLASLQFVNAAPTLSSSTPSNGATGIATSTALTMTFNEGVSAITNAGGAPAFWLCDTPQGAGPTYNLASCPAIATFEIGANTNNNAAPVGTASISTNTVTLTLPGSVSLANSKQYYLFASNAAVKDAVNNAFAGAQLSFTTAASAPATPPDVAPTTTTLPTGGGSASPTAGQTVVVTNNGNNGSTINLPSPPSSGTSSGATVTVTLPGTGNVAVSNNTAGTQLQVQNITLPGSSTPVSTVQVSNGSATLVASGAGQTLVTTGLSNGLTLTSGGSGTTATVTASGNSQTIAMTGNGNLTLGSSLDTQRTSVVLNQASSGGTPTQANLNIGGHTLSVSPGSSSATVQVVPTTTSRGLATSTLVVASGSANIIAQSSGQILNALPASIGSGSCPGGTPGSYFEAQRDNTQSNVLSVNQGNLGLTGFILQGVAAYHYTSNGPCNGFAMATPLDAGIAKEILIYQGEYIEVDKNSQPVKVVVRSQDGTSGAAGDPLTPAVIAGLTVDAVIPRLGLNTGRLPAGQTISQSIENMLKLSVSDWVFSAQDSQGVIRVSQRNNSNRLALLPIGEILVDSSRQDGVQCIGNGLCQTSAANISTTFNAALDAPQAFLNSLRQIDPTATLRLNVDGNLLLKLVGRTFAVQPGWVIQPTDGGNGFSASDATLWFAANAGRQALYPVFANLSRLQTVLQQADPTTTVQGNHQGGVIAVFGGQRYLLSPAWEVVATPVAHTKDDYWFDGGTLYINNLDGTAQGVLIK